MSAPGGYGAWLAATAASLGLHGAIGITLYAMPMPETRRPAPTEIRFETPDIGAAARLSPEAQAPSPAAPAIAAAVDAFAPASPAAPPQALLRPAPDATAVPNIAAVASVAAATDTTEVPNAADAVNIAAVSDTTAVPNTTAAAGVAAVSDTVLPAEVVPAAPDLRPAAPSQQEAQMPPAAALEPAPLAEAETSEAARPEAVTGTRIASRTAEPLAPDTVAAALAVAAGTVAAAAPADAPATLAGRPAAIAPSQAEAAAALPASGSAPLAAAPIAAAASQAAALAAVEVAPARQAVAALPAQPGAVAAPALAPVAAPGPRVGAPLAAAPLAAAPSPAAPVAIVPATRQPIAPDAAPPTTAPSADALQAVAPLAAAPAAAAPPAADPQVAMILQPTVEAGGGSKDETRPGRLRIGDFLAAREDDDCLLALPVSMGAQQASIEAFAIRPEAVAQLGADYERQAGIGLKTATRPVSAGQCSALTFARSLAAYPNFPLRLTLNEQRIRSGSVLSGVISGLRKTTLYLVVVDDEGKAELVDARLDARSTVASFSAPMTLTSEPVSSVQLLVAIAADGPLETVPRHPGMPAEEYFSRLATEIVLGNRAIAYGITSFEVE